VSEELADGNLFLALLREFRPVRAHPFFVVEPAARVGNGQGHCGQALGSRVDDYHGVLFPGLARLLISNTAPEINHLLTVLIDAAGAAQLSAPSEVLDEGLAHGLKATTDMSLYAL
jgi:hypothetical protein